MYLMSHLPSKRLFFAPFLVFNLAASMLMPTNVRAVQVGECNIHSSSRIFQTSSNPNGDRVLSSNIQDSAIQVDSHVLVSVSEISSEGDPFFGEAIFYVSDIAPYDGGFRLRTEVRTGVTGIPLDYKIFYTAFTGNCQ